MTARPATRSASAARRRRSSCCRSSRVPTRTGRRCRHRPRCAASRRACTRPRRTEADRRRCGIVRLVRGLVDRLGPDAVLTGSALEPYLRDATETRGLAGSADAVALPQSAEDVAAVVRWCYEHDTPITPYGGGTGYAGGAVPNGGLVLSLERLSRVRALEPELWRAEFEAGVTTRDVQRLARENGLWFPPDPGAPEQSQIGGNVATNAGGPHAFKHGQTGAWVTGIEAVMAPGELVQLGAPVRKDVAGYDVKNLMIG